MSENCANTYRNTAVYTGHSLSGRTLGTVYNIILIAEVAERKEKFLVLGGSKVAARILFKPYVLALKS